LAPGVNVTKKSSLKALQQNYLSPCPWHAFSASLTFEGEKEAMVLHSL